MARPDSEQLKNDPVTEEAAQIRNALNAIGGHRRAGLDETTNSRSLLDFVDGKRISTVMLPINHSFKKGKEVFWETMIFEGDEAIDYQTRCEGGREDAIAMHKRAIEYVLAGCPEEVG